MSRKLRTAEKGQGTVGAPAVRRVFADALQRHQAGHLNEAEFLYRQVLGVNPGHADSLHLLGVVAYQTGRHGLAVELIRKAIAINAGDASYHSNLGNAFKEQERLEEAVGCYREALALQPDFADAHSNLGNAFKAQGRLDDAVASYRRSLALRPDHATTHYNLGNALRALGQTDEAIGSYRKALDLKPDLAEASNNLGGALVEAGRVQEAVARYQTAISLKPAYPEALNNLAVALTRQRRSEEAAACCRRALLLRPDYAEAHTNLGEALKDVGRLDEAVACHLKALTLKPDYSEAQNNLGVALQLQGRLDDAIGCYRSAIGSDSGHAGAHNNLGMALLTQGHLAAGWAEYEWRLSLPDIRRHRRAFVQPTWRGDTADGQTVLIHAEQGFGDTLQFCRYATLVAARGLRVIMEVQPPLVRLVSSLTAVDQVVARGDALPDFNLHCPMLSVPLALQTTLATIPKAVPYLCADTDEVAAWRQRLAATGDQGARIGLAWAGSSTHLADRRRSLAWEQIAPLLTVPGVHLVSLQKGDHPAPVDGSLTDWMEEMRDFADTAALVSALDLVISVDTAVAHLAAALGKPVWLLDRFDPDWRWLIERRDSPWYPTLRIYRQSQPGDWTGVVDQVVQDLRRFIRE